MRIDHMTTQYVWTLENDQVFMIKAKAEIERGNFNQFRRLVGEYIKPAREMLGETHQYAISGAEWSFLYVEMWIRLNGMIYAGRMDDDDKHDFKYHVDRLRGEGWKATVTGVQAMHAPKSQTETTKENTMPSIEIKTVTFINDADVSKLTDEQLIDSIKKIEAEIADLSAVKTESSKIKAKVSALHDTLAKVVAILDAR